MGAWRKRGSLDPMVGKLLCGMKNNGINDSYAQQICEQIRGFGEYGFPESHAASFSRLVYVSAWLKHHYPDAFCAALLNSQPMGFYSARSLIDDARRHGVTVQPTDIQHSEWDCTLNRTPDQHLRLGLRQIRGFKKADALRIIASRAAHGPFQSIGELQKRAGLDRGAMKALAGANALRSLSRHRRQAIWAVQGLYDLPLFQGLQRPDGVELAHPGPAQEMREDFRSQGLSLDHNPVGMVRDRLDREGFLSAATAQSTPGGRTIRVAGMVAHRQRPSTANGIIFMTLEDETGLLNIVVKPHVFERQRKTILQHNLLEITARVQRDGDSMSLLATRFSPLDVPRPDNLTSRDFR
jgi:error-prone DNA polymerase